MDISPEKKYLSFSLILLVILVFSFFVYNIVKNINFYRQKKDVTVYESQTSEEYLIGTFINDPVLGLKTAPISLYLFANYENLKSREAVEIIDQIIKKYPQEVNLIWKDIPYIDEEDFQSGINVAASLAGKCVWSQNPEKYWEFNQALFVKKNNLRLDYYLQAIQDLGLDVNNFNLCYSSQKYLPDIIYNIQEAKVLRLEDLPVLFVNQYQFDREINFDNLDKMIEDLTN